MNLKASSSDSGSEEDDSVVGSDASCTDVRLGGHAEVAACMSGRAFRVAQPSSG